MKGELQMRFLGIADIEEGLGIFTIEEDCFKPEYFTEIHRQKQRFTKPSHDEVSMLLFRHL